MPRRRADTKRFYITVSADVAIGVEELAQRWGRPPTTVAGRLLSEAVDRALHPPADEVAQLRAELQAAASERDRLRRQVHDQRETSAPLMAGPRYEWPVADLMADAEWWDRWLPRLDELMGRRIQHDQVTRDARGYLELGAHLLRPIELEQGSSISWRSTEYPAEAWRRWEATHERRWAELATVWEPVVRHLAEALCLLEATAEQGDAYLRLRAKDELTGPWLHVLQGITGEADPSEVPLQPVGELAARQETGRRYGA
jgi:hypothetical protein